ncbi:hypothetical protein [Streptomyces sp. H27-D2]|uniref:hypothetical protein n=1 Tax=Streptomyces sp. H27-D2 TaxID=3046304 RepID=UPI002DBA05D8|nr:hypothetical protein [Streptomyces sp. H27-D2]MEC4018610.1 hypothetical protein [Streptomyces sp. H27-D2]
MRSPAQPLTRDRADFERALDRALMTPEIQAALRRALAGPDAGRLRSMALRSAEDICAAAAAEYARYTTLRSEDTAKARGRELLVSLAVLLAGLSGLSGVMFLLLGHGLRILGGPADLAAALMTVSWIMLTMTALALAANGATRWTAAAPAHGSAAETPAERGRGVARARAVWLRALVEYGLKPYLHRQLSPPEPASDREGPAEHGRAPGLREPATARREPAARAGATGRTRPEGCPVRCRPRAPRLARSCRSHRRSPRRSPRRRHR